MKETSGVYMVTNTVNNKRYVAISHDIENEWFNIKRDIRSGIGLKSLKEEFEIYGEEAFKFSVELVSTDERMLHRKESELAYELDVWHKGYNTKPLLNYRVISEENLASYKLQFFKIMNQAKDGKYMFTDLLEILDITKNDLEIMLREITEDEMKFFQRRVYLRNAAASLTNYYIEVKSL